MAERLVIEAEFREALKALQLASIQQVKAFRDPPNTPGKRQDTFQVPSRTPGELPFFLKRYWEVHLKSKLGLLIRRGKPCSMAENEWENSRAVQRAGLRTCALAAFGEEKGLLFEKFSFLLTQSAPGTALTEVLTAVREKKERKQIIRALAAEIRKLHQAGLFFPDLFLRHIFLDEGLKFTLIDLARLDRGPASFAALTARDLAALNASAPKKQLSVRERLYFLQCYAGTLDRDLLRRINARMTALLKRRKFKRLHEG